MRFSLTQLVVALALMGTVLLSGLEVRAQSVGESEQRQAYEQVLDERAALLDELNALEGRYRHLVQQIDGIKRQGVDNLKNRMELEGLLRQGRALSKQLAEIQQRLRQIDGRAERQRQALVDAIDERMRTLERSLARLSPTERIAVVAHLNELRSLRQRYAAPLPASPDLSGLNEAIRLAEGLEEAHPDEMLAAADELEDTEDQVRRRMEAVEARLSELKAARQLRRRARAFSQEERFFEEADRSRVIARYERKTPSSDGRQNDEEGNNASDPEPEAPARGDSPDPTAGAGDDAAEAPAPDYAEDGEVDDDGVWVGDDPDFDMPPGDGDRGSNDVPNGPSTDPEPPPANPDPTPTPEPNRETVVFESAVDPSTAVGPHAFDDQDLEQNIRNLEEERRRLSRQAEELREKARQLRDRAQDSFE